MQKRWRHRAKGERLRETFSYCLNAFCCYSEELIRVVPAKISKISEVASFLAVNIM